MNEEEKKAIECIKQELIEPFYNFPNPTSIELKDTKVELLERVLNLIEKQQKEKEKIVDKVKEKIEERFGILCMQLGSYERDNATSEQERIAGGINELRKLKKELLQEGDK